MEMPSGRSDELDAELSTPFRRALRTAERNRHRKTYYGRAVGLGAERGQVLVVGTANGRSPIASTSAITVPPGSTGDTAAPDPPSSRLRSCATSWMTRTSPALSIRVSSGQ